MKSAIEIVGSDAFTNYTSAPLDELAAACANRYVGNPSQEAIYEITVNGPKLRFNQSCTIAICGADLSPALNQVAIQNNHPYEVDANSVLEFGNCISGLRAYLACGSKSVVSSPYKLQLNSTLHCTPAPEFEYLPAGLAAALFSYKFTISKRANRMGVQLEQRLPNQLNEIITSPVLPGTVQLTPDGQLIILLADCQNTGGYPRLLQLDKAGLQQMAQLGPGATLQFSR
ncbi:MAG: biotin-dependent carboxyltransferase family protein [Planctomycetota bacterium]|nr:biotin-dependent carboxyltransferase family protein [Planctomycetota bacterium]